MTAHHTNTAGERISIEERKRNGVVRVHCIVIYDDAPPLGTGIAAPMLLDASTRLFLRLQLDALDALDAMRVLK